MHEKTGNLIQLILGLPIFRSEWVLYLLLFLSLASIGVMLERWAFFRRRSLDSAQVRDALSKSLDKGDLEGAAALLKKHDALETNVVLVGLQAASLGPESVEDLLVGALGQEKARYEKRLNFLATMASNAPYIGLFGTVLGIIRAFHDLAGSSMQGTQAVMSGIAEALVATGVGLIVALPAVATYNAFTRHVERATSATEVFAHEILASLKTVPRVARDEATPATRKEA